MSRQTRFFSLDSVKSGLRNLACDELMTQTVRRTGFGQLGAGVRSLCAAGCRSMPDHRRAARLAARVIDLVRGVTLTVGCRARRWMISPPQELPAGRGTGRTGRAAGTPGRSFWPVYAGDLRRDISPGHFPIRHCRSPKAPDLEMTAPPPGQEPGPPRWQGPGCP